MRAAILKALILVILGIASWFSFFQITYEPISSKGDLHTTVNNAAVSTMLTPDFGDVRLKQSEWFVIGNSSYVECNETKVKEFLHDNPDYFGSNDDKMRVIHKKNFIATKRALDNLGIPFFLSHGSLLGWRRECNFILHTHDIDFGIPSTAVVGRVNEMVEEMAKQGLEFRGSYGNVTEGFEISFTGSKGAPVDIFIFYNEFSTQFFAEGTVSSSLYLVNGFRRRMLFPMTKFVYTHLAGESVLIPERYAEWVEASYGPEWDKPKGGWNYWSSPFNRVFEDELPGLTEQQVMEKSGENLIANPSFESVQGNQLVYWTHDRGHFAPNAKGRKPNTKAVRLQQLSAGQSVCLYQDVNLGKYRSHHHFVLSGWSKPETVYPFAVSGYVMDPFREKYQVVVTFYYNDTDHTDEWARWLLFKPEKAEWSHKAFIIHNPVQSAVKARIALNLNIPKMSVLFDDIELRPISDCTSRCNHGTCVYGKCKCDRGWAGPNCDEVSKVVYKLD